MSRKYKIAFIHGRPDAHPFHKKLAESVHAESHFVDFMLKWHSGSAFPLKRYISWLFCAVFFPKRRKYDIFFSEGLHVPPVLMKKLGLLKKEQKIIALLDNEILYFLHSKKLPAFSHKFNKWLLNSYDKLIISGEMLTDLAIREADQGAGKSFTIFNGISKSRLQRLKEIKPEFGSKKILFIGNGPGGWRVWYKGMDILMDAFSIASSHIKELELNVVGQWEQQAVRSLLERVPEDRRHRVHFRGQAPELDSFLREVCLYVHCGRGEAFGISVLEAMAGGAVPLVSEWTGAKEAVKKVSPDLVLPLNPESFAKKIIWLLELDEPRRAELSARARQVSADYSEEKAVEHFLGTFYKAVSE